MQRIITQHHKINQHVRMQRLGMSALEVVLIVGAMLPVIAGLFIVIRKGLVAYHEHIGNVVGNPLL